MKNENISWIQLRNIAFIGSGIIASIISFMDLTAKVSLLDQKMELLLTNQEKIINSITSDLVSLKQENQKYSLRLKTLELQMPN